MCINQAQPTPAQPQPIDPGTPTTGGLPEQLTGLRAEIDRIDDALHDLLMRRVEIVEQVAGLARIGKIPFRPGREAAILRRLLARHRGRLAAGAIVRLWREMFAANIALQSPLLIAACEPDPADQMVQLAREHFGALTPLRVSWRPAEAMAEVRSGRATAAVLPMPTETGSAASAWWTGLLQPDAPRLHVVARLPFWASPRAEGAVVAQALVVAAAAPDASGDDRSLIGFTVGPLDSGAPLSGAIAAAGFGAARVLLRRDPSDAPGSGGVRGEGLIDVEGFVADDDARLGLLEGAVVLGSYAVPIEMPRP